MGSGIPPALYDRMHHERDGYCVFCFVSRHFCSGGANIRELVVPPKQEHASEFWMGNHALVLDPSCMFCDTITMLSSCSTI